MTQHSGEEIESPMKSLETEMTQVSLVSCHVETDN